MIFDSLHGPSMRIEGLVRYADQAAWPPPGPSQMGLRGLHFMDKS